jgi:hypothetical protein
MPAGGETLVTATPPACRADLVAGRRVHRSSPSSRGPPPNARIEAKDDVYAFNEDYRHRRLWRIAVVS